MFSLYVWYLHDIYSNKGAFYTMKYRIFLIYIYHEVNRIQDFGIEYLNEHSEV